ncbi:unnamed protein product [Eruca vesicaria subsp. sativa]|uniref:Uncharacterized protein n=1 Tax=Eruca vesicaria subsp. sativa TaxID=29727 RepID=A0ABC8M9R1_ERUVS|nr:unnamed protein product [Eruca vesicaria subsp. sativa]
MNKGVKHINKKKDYLLTDLNLIGASEREESVLVGVDEFSFRMLTSESTNGPIAKIRRNWPWLENVSSGLLDLEKMLARSHSRSQSSFSVRKAQNDHSTKTGSLDSSSSTSISPHSDREKTLEAMKMEIMTARSVRLDAQLGASQSVKLKTTA